MSYTIPLEPGKFYHIYNRGNNGENIFIAERNYAYFLNLYARHITPVAETFSYSLLRNHFHLLTRIRDQTEPLAASQAFSNFFNAYTKSINRAYERTGALFERPFRRIEITTPQYCLRLVHSIHWNPQKHGFVKDFRDWPYISYYALLSDRATFLQRQQVLDWFNGRIEFDAIHQTLTEEKNLAELIGDDED
jgi:REP element-mobilizing transposase RayT